MRKISFIVIGLFTFGLGTLGIILPFLPTTVFYLLTAFFWIRSSDRLYQKFIHSNVYTQYVDRPIIKKQITNKGIFKMFITMFIVFLVPCILVDNLVMRVTMGIVYLFHLIGITWYLKRKSKTKIIDGASE
ncbi:hypothetical protein IGI86_002624 [Enterococcus sp. AZ188]|uniref:YbaN family protein n=1 Tax=Enterococcus sp. AZ188 TaxID=2774678 RepID=UPI003D300CF4